MSRILYEIRCKCKEEFSITKKPKRKRKPPKPRQGIRYPDFDKNEIIFKTFQIKYEKKISLIAISALNSFQNKYLYYAIDDLLDLLKLNPIEQKNLLSILYSPVLSLHNNFSVNFFDIWIHEIYINEKPKINKFLTNDFQNLEQFSYITIKLFYKTRIPIKKQESLW